MIALLGRQASVRWCAAAAGPLAILAATSSGTIAQQPVFKARVDAVRVDVLVTRGGHSMKGEPMQHLKDAAHAAAESLRADDRASLITFSHVVQKRLPWSADAAAIRAGRRARTARIHTLAMGHGPPGTARAR